ncbi:MAG: hypothetical protein A3E84_01200 [Gammaproteobacteria bacterium RIFCSPHIGHO2_12_FULL_42_13]|nr:MAG: hypothetical protein A3E84_01200 [Gammaproteobacteria bacterium RIFCSPHIGHO2_12_FULL_42_13]
MLSTTIHSIKNEIKEILTLGIPLVSAQLIYACSGFIGTAMVAQLGKDALAASILVSMIWMSLSVFFFGILNATSVLVSHQYGAKNNTAISEIMGQSYLLGVIVCVPMMLTLLSMPWLLRWSTQPPEVLNLAYKYMYALLWTTPGLVILVVTEQFLAGIGRAKFVLRISIMVVPIEIFLIYLFIFGKWGMPKLGIAGVGFGFAVTYTATAIALIFYLVKANLYRHFHILNGVFSVNAKYLIELIRLGLPMGFMYLIEVSTFAIATFWMARFGTTMLAAHQIAMQYLSFAITLVFAMGQAVTIRVGHSVGRQDLSGIRYAVYIGMVLNFICVLIVALAFYFIPELFLHLDLDIYDPANRTLIHDSSLLLAISGALLIFDNFRILGFGALRGLKDTHFSMYSSFVSFWLISLSTAFLLGFTWDYQGQGIWWGLTFGIGCGALIVFLRLHYLLRRIDLQQLAEMVKPKRE